MATTLRIVHQGTEPLDGTTPIPQSALHMLREDPTRGLAVLVLPPGSRFGLLDPGFLQRLGGPSATTVLRSLTLVSQRAPGHAPGCHVALQPPGLRNPAHARILADLGVFCEGLIPQMPAVPCPPGHAFVFDTRADGESPGPHLIQLTFEPARLPSERMETLR